MKPKSPVQKNNLVVFPYEYTHVYPYRYTWYICISMMIYTSLQEYLHLPNVLSGHLKITMYLSY